MIFALDASLWIALYDSQNRLPIDPETGEPVAFVKERVESIIADAEKAKDTILVPAPVLTEVLTVAGERRFDVVATITGSSRFKVGNFDTKAAIELAELNQRAIASGDKRLGSTEAYQKIKLDRQIVSICIAQECDFLYTTDRGMKNFAVWANQPVKHLLDIPVPDSARQGKLFD